jgi:hypothetical protein
MPYINGSRLLHAAPPTKEVGSGERWFVRQSRMCMIVRGGSADSVDHGFCTNSASAGLAFDSKSTDTLVGFES